MNREIEEFGIDLVLELEYYEEVPGTYYDPPDGGYVVITDVFHKDESIIDIVSSVIRDRWEREWYDELTEEFNTPPED